jgi:type VI secretion system Hcp family effector
MAMFLKLKIDGIAGEMEDESIEVFDASHGVRMPMNEAGKPTSSGLRTYGSAQHGHLKLTLGVSKAIPKLLEACHNGKLLEGNVTLTGSRMSGGKQEPYLLYTLTDAFVSGIELTNSLAESSEQSGAGILLKYTMTLDYKSVKLTVTSFDEMGMQQGSVETGDLTRKS